MILGWWNPSTGKYFMYDGWLRNYLSPTVDDHQGIFNKSASQIDGITTLNFARKRISQDALVRNNSLFSLYHLRCNSTSGVGAHREQGREIVHVMSG